MGQELRRSFMEEFGQPAIECRSTLATWVPVYDIVILYFGRLPLVSVCSLRVRTPSCDIPRDPAFVLLSGGQQPTSTADD